MAIIDFGLSRVISGLEALSKFLVIGTEGAFGKQLHPCSSWVVWETPRKSNLFELVCQETELATGNPDSRIALRPGMGIRIQKEVSDLV